MSTAPVSYFFSFHKEIKDFALALFRIDMTPWANLRDKQRFRRRAGQCPHVSHVYLPHVLFEELQWTPLHIIYIENPQVPRWGALEHEHSTKSSTCLFPAFLPYLDLSNSGQLFLMLDCMDNTVGSWIPF